MNTLNIREALSVSAGTLEESVEIRNGYLTSTLHIPPHTQELTLDVLFQLKDLTDLEI